MPMLAAVLAIFAYALTAPLLGVMLPSYPLPSGQLGNLGLANAAGFLVASLSAGPIGDTRGKKPVLLAGLGLLLAAMLSAGFVGQYSGLLVLYFVLGSGGGAVTNSANSMAGDIAPERRGPALNLLNLFFGLGGMVTTFVSGYALKPLALCAAVSVVCALALAAVAFTPSPLSRSSNSVSRQAFATFAFLRQPSLMLFALLLFFYVSCEVGVWNWLRTYLMALGFSYRSAGGVTAYGFALGMLLGRLAASRLLLKASAIVVVSTSGIIMALSTFAMLNLKSPTAMTVAVLCAGLSMGPVFPTTLAMIGDRFSRGAATAMGIAITAGWLGPVVFSPFIGKVADATNLQHAMLLLPLLASAMVLVSLVLRSNLLRTVTV